MNEQTIVEKKRNSPVSGSWSNMAGLTCMSWPRLVNDSGVTAKKFMEEIE
jgi:hypothetical protein